MKTIPLSNGGETLVDDDVFRWASRREWSGLRRKNTTYVCLRGDVTVLLHRVILGTASGKDTDHRDGNGLNNQRQNLQELSHSDNTGVLSNSEKRKDVQIPGSAFP